MTVKVFVKAIEAMAHLLDAVGLLLTLLGS
jgi:hypothetical protein